MMRGDGRASDPLQPLAVSPWAPFHHVTFLVVWIATVVSNVGGWMSSAASGWLMTSLDPDPLTVSLVQAATSLPMFLLALPAGALADIVDRRHLLIVVECSITAVGIMVAVLVGLNLVTPALLLALTFLANACEALIAPAWQAVVPQLVSKDELTPAIAANSVGVNISRAIGPALGGIVIGLAGIGAPFWVDALSNLAVIAALLWWRSSQRSQPHFPAERFKSAIRIGLRYGRNNSHLRATLVRAAGFFFFASAYWALLPLVARSQLAGGPELYGILLSAIGAGAIAGALCLTRMKTLLGPDRLVAVGGAGTAIALLLFGLAHDTALALIASTIAGFCWIAVMSSLNVSAQVALPEWVRGRGLALMVTAFFGAMTLGSAVWGEAAVLWGLPATHFIAAAGVLAAIPLTWKWKLQTGSALDLSPSMHWLTPITKSKVAADRGPVLVTVEYAVDPENREPFLVALQRVGRERRRDGAYSWGSFEDTAQPGHFLEFFLVESWLEHLRQHERVTKADRRREEAVRAFQIGAAPKVTHFVAASPSAARGSRKSARK
jgi:MFS family permease